MNHSGLKSVLIIAFLISLGSCSQKNFRVLFDIPNPDEDNPTMTNANEGQKKSAEDTQLFPSHPDYSGQIANLENLRSWEQAEKILPKFPKVDIIDWTSAMQKGIITPSATLDGKTEPNAFVFAYDFFIKGPSPMFDAYFPHSIHTQLLNCRNCHPRIFRSPAEKMTMEKLNAGKYCGVCHGKIAFGLNNCVLCHTSMGQ